MKLHQATTTVATVTGYGDGWIEVNGARYEQAVLVFPDRAVAPWSATTFDALAPEDFADVLAYAPEVLVLGTGRRQRFAHPRITAALHERRIGVESMDTQAACRTYNILSAEGRRVAVALLLD